MKHSEAMQIVNEMLAVAQKMRSNEKEFADHLSEDGRVSDRVLETIQPWLFGPKSVLVSLLKASERGSVEPQSFYNFLFIFHRLEPALETMYVILTGKELPEPKAEILKGWDKE
jgi:hypothetical protein